MKSNYPPSIAHAIDESNRLLDQLKDKLKANNHRRLDELYYIDSAKSKVRRRVEVFNDLRYTPTVCTNKKSNKNNELSGLYVFCSVLGDQLTAEYIGISRTIFRRLRQHGWGTSDNQASLAYLMAREVHKPKKRKDISKEQLEEQQTKVRSFKVIILPIEHSFQMYFTEVYLAGVLQTQWNDFTTH